MSTFYIQREAAAAMRDAGMEPVDAADVRADGVLCRFDCVGDKRGKRNAWAVVFPDGKRPVAVFGHWARDIRQSVTLGDPAPMTALEREQAEMAIHAAQRQRDRELKERRDRAQRTAEKIWTNAPDATEAHPYLQRKRIRPHGMRLHELDVVVPIHAPDGSLVSLQFIRADGRKKFLPGGRVSGCYAFIGKGTEHILVCEGFATGASLQEATGLPVACALSASNMKKVAGVMLGKYPGAKLTVCGDNDDAGITAANDAAAFVRGSLAIPPEPGDWNDYITAHGIAALEVA